ncbi:MAG: dATP pyrophosphohydrolase [Aestuariivirgaceae bacterium]
MPHPVEIMPVEGGHTLKQFVRLPRELYQGIPGYSAPLDLQRLQELDRRRNPYFAHADAALWLALQNGRPVGRISAQIDRLEAESRPGLGHFGNFAAIDHGEVAGSLFRAAEQWLRLHGVRHVTGPYNLSINQESGLLIEGHQEQPMFLMPWDAAWLPALLEQQGYRAARDLFAYRHDGLDAPQHKGRRLLDRIGRDPSVKARFADLRRIDQEISVIADVFNDAWVDNWGFVPLTVEEVTHMAKELKPFIHNESMTVIEVEGEPQAFAFALPNLLELSDGLDGRLVPFGWARVLSRYFIRPIRSERLALMGVKRRYRDNPLGAALAFLAIEKLREGSRRRGVVAAELGWVLDTNERMRSMLEDAGARHYKTYRVYEKLLASTDAAASPQS